MTHNLQYRNLINNSPASDSFFVWFDTTEFLPKWWNCFTVEKIKQPKCEPTADSRVQAKVYKKNIKQQIMEKSDLAIICVDYCENDIEILILCL